MQLAPFQWGPAQAGAQLGAGAFPPNPQNASFASISHSMVAKDAAKRELKLKSEEGGALFFILREGHAMSSVLLVATLSNLVRKVVEPTTKMQICCSRSLTSTCFGPPVPGGWSQFPRHPAKHFDIITALATDMTYGTESSSDISATRRTGL